MAVRQERTLILCKTYPSPSGKYAETSCVAGLTESGQLIHLYPVPYRLISDEQQFRKWQWLTAKVEKARDDHRPESHRIYIDTIAIEGEPMSAGEKGWPARMELLFKAQLFADFDAVEQARQSHGTTLALLRPARITKVEIKKARNPEWTAEEIRKLAQAQRQSSLFDEAEATRDVKLLEKVPFDFYYHYECDVHGASKQYHHKLVDWEAGALYRRLWRQYGEDGWQDRFRQKYETEFAAKDTTFMLGTIHRFPNQWLIVSVFAPPKPHDAASNQEQLF